MSSSEPWVWAAWPAAYALLGLIGWICVKKERREAVINRELARRIDERHRWELQRMRLECRRLKQQMVRGFD